MESCYNLSLPSKWVNGSVLEFVISKVGQPHAPEISSAVVTLPIDCNVMVDAAARLLSLVNQLAYKGCPVVLDFEEGMSGVMGYFDRLGFFDHLHKSVETLPLRPIKSAAQIYAGKNPSVVEFKRLNPAERDDDIPGLLADALEAAYDQRSDRVKINRAAFTVFGELIDNIYEHSNTPIDGYAALQVYPNGRKALVVVSDSGEGLLNTLRPALAETPLSKVSDPELIVHTLTQGVSRYIGEKGRGLGLKQCAQHALKYNAQLHIRLPTSYFKLTPASGTYRSAVAVAYGIKTLPHYWGTHVAFEFRLDESK